MENKGYVLYSIVVSNLNQPNERKRDQSKLFTRN